MVKTKSLKHPHLWLQCFFNSSACIRNCFGSAVCTIGKTNEAPKVFVYWFIFFFIIFS